MVAGEKEKEAFHYFQVKLSGLFACLLVFQGSLLQFPHPHS